MTNAQKLGWGAAALVPEGAKAAWGARMIITQSGDVDLVYDRQHAVGDDASIDALIAHLNGGVIKQFKDKLSGMLRRYEVSTTEGADVVLYEDDTVKVAGNSNGSHGYFYVAAWLKEE
jgi:hypothetical protein